MEDIFYFTKRNLRYGNIAECAIEKGYRHELITVGGDILLNINYDDEDRFWQWDGAFTDNDILDMIQCFEEPEADKILDYKPGCSFGISYRQDSLPVLLKFMRYILEKYGGWVKNDDDSDIFYDHYNIEELTWHFVE